MRTEGNEGREGIQSQRADNLRSAVGVLVPGQSAAVRVDLVSDEQLAARLGVCKRTAAEIQKAEWAPRPIILGPRLKRHNWAEWEAALASAPRQAVGQGEPAQLRRAKIERMKATGAAA